MKKAIRPVLSLLLLLSAISAQAQLGIRFGYTYMPSRGTLSLNNGAFTGTTHNNGFQAGLTYDFNIVGELDIQTALLYTYAGGTTREKNKSAAGIYGTLQTRSTYQFIDVPIRAAYSLPVTNDFKFFIFGGPVLSYAFSGQFNGWQIKGTYPNGMSTENTSHWQDKPYDIYTTHEVSPFELRLGAGLGVHYKQLRLQFSYDWGLLDLYSGGTKSNKIHRDQLSLSLGYVLW